MSVADHFHQPSAKSFVDEKSPQSGKESPEHQQTLTDPCTIGRNVKILKYVY